MCVICVSRSGIRQPNESTLRTMFEHNPHGAGYMVARDGRVEIHKGYMDIEEFLEAIRNEHFTTRDSVVYHFRISTQAGINPEMTHPFPLSNQRHLMRELDLEAPFGVAHNGIIKMTTDPRNRLYSDTAIFITDYLSRMITKPSALRNKTLLNTIYQMARSKFAIMDQNGYVATVGDFINDHGLLYSNESYLEYRYRYGWKFHK